MDGPWFKDVSGRTILLRGVNVSGACKLPSTPFIPSHSNILFHETRHVSFVDRPFPLIEADEHLSRLKHWGFNFIRLNVTWEALEHEGPGIYDYAFMDYIVALLIKAKHYDFRLFIDPHQDVWSRFSGGSGAPGWTLEVAGLDMTAFEITKAAIVHNTYGPNAFPKMIWPTNYHKLATATMFTLFFGGNTFAPKCLVEGVPIQDYLQTHYFNAFKALAQRIHDTPGLENDVVIGYDTLNEPSCGWIDCEDLSEHPADQSLKHGLTPTPFQCMLLGSGMSASVENWIFGSFGPQKEKDIKIDPKGVSAWSQGCVWEKHGVWDPKTGVLLKYDYFSKNPETGDKVDFLCDFWKPFVLSFSREITSIHKDAIIFVEPPVNAIPPVIDFIKEGLHRVCYTPHWYDGLTLMQKNFNSWFNIDYIGFLRGQYSNIAYAIKFGKKGIDSAFKSQLATIKKEGQKQIGNFPCAFGEIGIPYDMNSQAAYKTGNFSTQIKAMDANLKALEENFLNFTLWNYCPINTHTHGDHWNGEDLSIWSRDDIKHSPAGTHELSKGGRAVAAFSRPFAVLTPGTPLFTRFELEKGIFKFKFSHSKELLDKVVLYVPKHHFACLDSSTVEVSDGTWEYNEKTQLMSWMCACHDRKLHPILVDAIHSIKIKSKKISETVN